MATAVNREDLYKKSGGDISDIRAFSKATQRDAQLRHREQIITNKRFKVDNLESAESLLSAAEEKERVEKAIKQLKHGRNVEALKTLYRSFAKDCSHAETFIKAEGLPLLQGCFLSADSELLHAAAWCAVNLSAGQSNIVKRVMCLSPTLIQFLSGSDRVMQESCAWAVANLAGDSQRNKQILLEQGCLIYLVNIVATRHNQEYEELLRSALFALINLAKDQTFACIRRMQENSICQHIETLLTHTPPESELCYEIGWLLNCIYSRKETLTEYSRQLLPVLHLVLNKLSQLIQIEKPSRREKVILPYIHCVGNAVGQRPDLAVALSEDVSFYTTTLACLQCDDIYIQKEILWLLQNFTAEPSCRVLMTCQSNFLSAIFSSCHNVDVDMALLSLELVESMTNVSCYINKYLLQQGLIGHLVKLTTHPDHRINQSSFRVLSDLVSQLPKECLEILETTGAIEVVKHHIVQSSGDMQGKTQNLLTLLEHNVSS